MEANFRLGDWEVYPTLNRLQRGEEVQHLEPKVMDLLVYLAHHPGEVQSRERSSPASDSFKPSGLTLLSPIRC